MRLVSFEAGGAPRYGILDGERIVDMGARLGPGRPDLLSVLRAGELASLRAAAAGAAADFALADVRLLPPVPNPEKILCVGVNYLGRHEEFADPQQHRYPSLFYRAPGSLVGHGAPLLRPAATAEFDYEGEIALVIGSACRYADKASALDCVIGATLCNEGTVHDWLSHGRRNNTPGKNFDCSGSIGPALVTADELDLHAPLTLTTRVNGELRQQDTTARMIFSFADLLAYITSFTTLKPGDVVVTGTPVGCGRFFQPPRWLAAGDVVEVSVPQLGTLRNAVADEVRAAAMTAPEVSAPPLP